MKKNKLFCFPYAGGSSAIYSPWKSLINNSIELIPIELAGRGRRINEPLYQDLPAAIDDVFKIIRNEITDCNYAFFGHSLGGTICYELALKIRENNLPGPVHIFFSGRSAPHLEKEDKFHLLSEEDFIEKVKELGGTSPEFFDHPQLMELFLPLIKNDFKLAETYCGDKDMLPLDCNITVFLGKDDDLVIEDNKGWECFTKKLCSIHYFEGNHFFINQEFPQIIRFINSALVGNIYSL